MPTQLRLPSQLRSDDTSLMFSRTKLLQIFDLMAFGQSDAMHIEDLQKGCPLYFLLSADSVQLKSEQIETLQIDCIDCGEQILGMHHGNAMPEGLQIFGTKGTYKSTCTNKSIRLQIFLSPQVQLYAMQI